MATRTVANESSFPGFVAVALAQLEALACKQGITGYCLITLDGQVLKPAKGPLSTAFSVKEDEPIVAAANSQPQPPAAVQFLRAFNCLEPSVSFTILGTKLHVVHQDEGSIFALGPRHRLGLGLCKLQQGVAAVTFDRSLTLPAAVAATQRCADAIRARCELGA